jgi:hypothetical protein
MTALARTFQHICVAAALVASAMASTPAHAWLGALAKLGSAGGKAATVGKGAAAGGAAVASTEIATGANAAAKVGKVGAGADQAAGVGAHSADELSKASGLGKAVPDDIAAMLSTPGKTLLDVPDTGARAWLATPPSKLTAADANLMVTDYVKLLQGKPAKGPSKPSTQPVESAAQKAPEVQIPGMTPPNQVPWHSVELLARAAHIGHRAAQSELNRLCSGAEKSAQRPAQCTTATTTAARKP